MKKGMQEQMISHLEEILELKDQERIYIVDDGTVSFLTVSSAMHYLRNLSSEEFNNIDYLMIKTTDGFVVDSWSWGLLRTASLI